VVSREPGEKMSEVNSRTLAKAFLILGTVAITVFRLAEWIIGRLR